MGTEHYFGAARTGGAKHDLDALTFRINHYLSDQIYLSGQAHSATLGNAGGFSVGLLGAGFRSKNLPYGLTAGAELLAGAAGGGNVDTSGGVVIQPMAYIGMNLTDSVGVRLQAGHIKSLKGKLNSNILEISANFAFGTTHR
jgi:hypothetical protein